MPAHDPRHESAARVSKPHLTRHVIHENVMYPAHAPRTESPEYAAEHHRLVVEEDRPCFICGVKNSTLADPEQNPAGASALETHHLWVEWSLINATDPEKLDEFFGEQLDAEGWSQFLDHDERNLLVLCDVHHRHKEAGIHELTYPIWVAQKFVANPDTILPPIPPTNSSTSPRSIPR